MSLNIIAIMGRMAKDPEIRQTQSGKSVASFCVACDRSCVAYDRSKPDASGTRQADFIDCVAWERTADFVDKYFHKGDMIAVDGRLQTRSYQDKQGNNRKAVEIVANGVNFCGGKTTRGDAENPVSGKSAAPQYARNNKALEDGFELVADNSDLPF